MCTNPAPTLLAREAPSSQVGGCNTCTEASQTVWVIRGYARNLEFRLCPACMNLLNMATNHRSK